MAEVPLPFELCLKNLNGDDVSVQIDPGETFQQFIEKTETILGYILDVNSITNGDIIDLDDDMYNYFLKIEQQITQLPPEQRDQTGNIVFEESEMAAEEPETIYVWEDGTPIDPSLITFENGMAILKVPEVEEDSEVKVEALPQKEEITDDDPEDAPLQISETAEETAVKKKPEPSARQSSDFKPGEPMSPQKQAKVSGAKSPTARDARMEIIADFNSDEGEVEMLDEELLLKYDSPFKVSARHREYPSRGRPPRRKYIKNREDDLDYDPRVDEDELQHKTKELKPHKHKRERTFEKTNHPMYKQVKYKRVEPESVKLHIEKDVDEEIELKVEKALDDDIISKDDLELEIHPQDDDGLVEGAEKPNQNLNYKLVPSRNSDFAAQFSFFLGEQLKADPSTVAKEVAKSSVKIKSIQRSRSNMTDSRTDSNIVQPSISNQSIPPIIGEDEPLPKSKFRVKETTESAPSTTPKITQFKIVAPFSLKSRYGSPPLESPKKVSPPRWNPPASKSPTPSWRKVRSPPPRYSPPRATSPYAAAPRTTWETQRPLWESVKKPTPVRSHSASVSPPKPSRLWDVTSEDDIDDSDYCHFCVKLLMSESEKAFILNNKNEDNPFDRANRKISKVLCEGCLNRGYIEVQTKAKLLGPDEMYIVKDNDYFIYKKKSAVVKRKREGIVYSTPKIPKLQFNVKAEKDTLKSEEDLKPGDLDFDDLLVERKGKSVILTFNTESALDKKLDRIAASDSDDDEIVFPKPVVRKKKVDIKTETLKQTPTDIKKLAGAPKSRNKFTNEVFEVGDDKDYIHQFKIVDINKITGGKIKSGFKPSPTSKKPNSTTAGAKKPIKNEKQSPETRLVSVPQPIVKLTKLDDPVLILTSKRAHKVNQRYGNYFSKLQNYVSRSTPEIKTPVSSKGVKRYTPLRNESPSPDRSTSKARFNKGSSIRSASPDEPSFMFKHKKVTSVSKASSSRSTSPEQLISTPKIKKGTYASKTPLSPNSSISGTKIKKGTYASKTLSSPANLTQSWKNKKGTYSPKVSSSRSTSPEHLMPRPKKKRGRPLKVLPTRNPALEKLIQNAKREMSKVNFKKLRENSDSKTERPKKATKLTKSASKINATDQVAKESPVDKQRSLKGVQIEELLQSEKIAEGGEIASKNFNLVLGNETDDDIRENLDTAPDNIRNTKLGALDKTHSTVENVKTEDDPFLEEEVLPEYCCRLCDRKMQYITLVVSHSIRHQNINDKEFPCIICPKTFQDYRAASKHMKTEHAKPDSVPDTNAANPEKSPDSKSMPEKRKDLPTLAQSQSVAGAEQAYSENDDDDDVTKTLKSIFGMNEGSSSVTNEARSKSGDEPIVKEADSTSKIHRTVESTQAKPEPKNEKIKVVRKGPPNKAEKELVKALLRAYDVMDLDEEILEQLKSNLLKTIRSSSGDGHGSETESLSIGEAFHCLLCREKFKTTSELKMHECPSASDHRNTKKKLSQKQRQSVHQCPKCGEIRQTLSRLKFHLRFHEPPYMYQNPVTYNCRLCSELFKNDNSLYNHMVLVHLDDLRAHYSLEKSSKQLGGVFVGQRGIDSFSRKARQERRKVILPPRCQVCFKRMPRRLIRSHLKTHALTFHEGSIFYCIVCQESFDSAAHAEKHASLTPGCLALKDKPGIPVNPKTHDSGEDIVAQDLRQLRILFEELSKKSRTVIRVKTLKKAYKCEYCDRTFVNKMALRDHWDIHAKATLPFVCLSCNKNFASQGRLFSHIVTECTHKTRHSNITPVVPGNPDSNFPVVRLYLCTDCDDTFLHWTYVKAHQKICHSKHTFKCEYCTKEFRSSWSVNQHKKIDHKKIHETKIFKCTECQFTANAEKNLNEHKQSVHAGFKCSLCGTKFATKRWMEFHEKSHENQQLYRCAKCPKAFRHSHLLRDHFNSEHHDANNQQNKQPNVYTWYKCPDCPERFFYEKDLNHHRKIHEMELNITFPTNKLPVIAAGPIKTIFDPKTKMIIRNAEPKPNLSAHPLMSANNRAVHKRTAANAPRLQDHLLQKKYDSAARQIDPLMAAKSAAAALKKAAIGAPKRQDHQLMKKYNPDGRQADPMMALVGAAASKKAPGNAPKRQYQQNATVIRKYESTSKLIIREESEKTRKLKIPESQRANVPGNVMSQMAVKTEGKDEFDMTEFFKKMQPNERQPSSIRKFSSSISKMETVGKPKQPTPRPERNSLLQTLANSPRINPKSRIETMDQLFGNITKTLFNTPDGPQVETKKILGKGRGSKLSTPRKAAAERKGKDRRDLASDGRKLINHPGQMVHSGMSKSVNMGNVFHMVENQRNDEALTISMEVHQPLQFSDGTVAQSVDAAIAKSMDIGDVLNLLEGEAVVGDLTVPQAVDIRENAVERMARDRARTARKASLSGSLPIVIDDSGTLNVVLGAEDLQQSSSLELEAVVQPQEAVLESDEGMQAASESYLMEYASQEGETPQNEAGLSAEQPSDDNNIMIVDEDGQPIMNDEMQAQSGNIVVTTSGHIIIQGQVFKLDMKEGTTLDLEKISIRQDEDGQIFLETIEPDTGAEDENAETNEP